MKNTKIFGKCHPKLERICREFNFFSVFFKNCNPACIGQAHAVNEGIGPIRASANFLVEIEIPKGKLCQ